MSVYTKEIGENEWGLYINHPVLVYDRITELWTLGEIKYTTEGEMVEYYVNIYTTQLDSIPPVYTEACSTYLLKFEGKDEKSQREKAEKREKEKRAPARRGKKASLCKEKESKYSGESIDNYRRKCDSQKKNSNS